ncbi:hypothetical protein BN7_1420 [Wickerhamomyces ciferrii]|uniref:Uncharacterized protein n=1 Tax=Wickerhamomyces ciferrii (strain ATCC 14091 / BCRC 22168 / CBS 111 / JCM 3599 / NBRC 0793 / NRRL Y-1031 F-60-10) TaxID=1206466 RepID=K0KG19_WICCF|nr:uncharacterized protein BN7_1420 [Wickerhamomyces ciferrii]CCH41881.1 hypothetical protein BN7_1420 [Wickerhamomyces ciferrii]
MSRASKITLASTIISKALHQGPIKDAQRQQEKALRKKLLVNQQEHEIQQELRKQYEQLQPLSGQTFTAEEKKPEPEQS